MTAAEEFANYPGNVASPESKGKNRETTYGLDENPYGGYVADHDRYREYGGDRQESYGSAGGGSQVVWQGPTEDALRAHAQREEEQRQYQSERGHDYEYEQQRQMDADAVAWRETQPPVQEEQEQELGKGNDEEHLPNPHAGGAPWEPLSIKRGQTPTTDHNTTNGATTPIPHFPTPPINVEHQLGAPADIHPPVPAVAAQQYPAVQPYPSQAPASDPLDQQDEGGMDELAPPNAAFMDSRRARTPQAPSEAFYTPMTDYGAPSPIDQLEQLERMEKDYTLDNTTATDTTGATSAAAPPAPPPPPPPPPALVVPSGRDSPTPASPSTYSPARGGKISAAAFRRGAKPRMSGDDEESRSIRRLPVPPLNPADVAAPPVPATTTAAMTKPNVDPTPVEDHDRHTQEGHGAFGDAKREADPPPVYAGEESLR